MHARMHAYARTLFPPAASPHAPLFTAHPSPSNPISSRPLARQVLQQKGIGEKLGSSLEVKSAVGVNSDLIKAIRYILEQAPCCLLPAACCLLSAACCLLPAACCCLPRGLA